ncbi:MAG TPA: hypothetical protein DCF63_20850, partial [Planctomycetaceae bacterium]|nr:hypothetical protein [Planctomycetaceae bacterium]
MPSLSRGTYPFRWPFVIVAILLATVWILRTQSAPLGFSVQSYGHWINESVHYILFLPYSKRENEKLPVILFLNGYGENGTDGVKQLSNNFGQQIWELRGRFPFIVVAPQMSHDSSWAQPDSYIAQSAIEIVQ